MTDNERTWLSALEINDLVGYDLVPADQLARHDAEHEAAQQEHLRRQSAMTPKERALAAHYHAEHEDWLAELESGMRGPGAPVQGLIDTLRAKYPDADAA